MTQGEQPTRLEPAIGCEGINFDDWLIERIDVGAGVVKLPVLS
jgi:hypothetical protein